MGGEAAASRSVSSQNAQSQDLTPQPLSQAASQTGTSTGISDDTATGSVADPAKRQQALEEIRAKAAASSGEKTRIGTVPEAASEQMSLQEQSAIAAELEESRRATGSELSDAEVEARKAAIRRLQQKGKTHYERALDSIEN